MSEDAGALAERATIVAFLRSHSDRPLPRKGSWRDKKRETDHYADAFLAAAVAIENGLHLAKQEAGEAA